MVNEHLLTVKEITRETSDAISVVFDIPDNAKNDFKYFQGQNITLIKTINGNELRRSYSICSSVNDSIIKVAIKQLDGGRFSTWANSELQTGDTLRALTPAGHFYTALHPDNKKHYFAIAAGSGITPILSIIKTTLEEEQNSTFTLLYGNKKATSIMFLKELNTLEEHYSQRLSIFHILTQQQQTTRLLNGRIDSDKVTAFLKTLLPANNIDNAFLCGPFDMVTASRQALINMGLCAEYIHTELFGVPDNTITHQEAVSTDLPINDGNLAQVEIVCDSRVTHITLPRDGDTILDAALEFRDDLPFACKGGVCGTCKAKVVNGEVAMDINYSLSDAEVEQGFILTCQAHPISNSVAISFDEDS